MPRISTDNYDTVASWNGSQDLFVVEQPDGTKVATPAMVKQYILNDMDEVPTQDSDDLVKSGGVFSAIDDVYSVMGQMGAKNLIPYPYYETTKTQNGVTFTDNGDGTITANGTATGTAQFGLVSRINSYFYLPNGTYTVTGCPNTSGCQIRVGRTVNNADSQYGQDTGSGLTFTRTDATNAMGIALQIASGTTVSNLTFKPMLRLASDTDDTYQPYAKTNRQLTEEIGDLSQTGLTGDSVAEQLGDASGQIGSLKTPTLIWEGSATDVGTTYNMTENYTDFKYLLVSAKTNVEVKNMLIPTSSISASTIFSDVLSAGTWNSSTNAFTYNSCYGIKFTAANKFQLAGLTYNNSNWILKPVKIYGIG